MTVRPNIEVDARQRARLERTLSEIPRGADRAIHGAIRNTGKMARTIVRRQVSKNLNVAQKELRDIGAVSLRFRSSKGSLVNSATLTVSGQRIPLKRYAPRQIRAGVSYRGEGGGRSRIEGAFIVRTLGGHVFARKGDARLPIVKLHGASPAHAAIHDGKIKGYIADTIPATLQKNLANQVDRLLKRAGRGGRS